MINIVEFANRVGGIDVLVDALKAKQPGYSLSPTAIYNWNSRRRVAGAWELALVEVAADHGEQFTLEDLRGAAVEAAE